MWLWSRIGSYLLSTGTSVRSMGWKTQERENRKTPAKVTENEGVKIQRDFQIQTDRMMMANQPDLLVVDKNRGNL